jgi:hypothetical protein
MNLWISVLKLLIMDFGYSKLTYSYVIVEEKFTGVWVVVFSCTRPCWVWGVTNSIEQETPGLNQVLQSLSLDETIEQIIGGFGWS